MERVSANRSLLNQVKPLIDSLWPCINDTAREFIKGKIDSIPYNVYVPVLIDTSDRKRIIDSISLQQKSCSSAVEEGYNQGFKAAQKKYSSIKVPVPTPDTIRLKIIDNRKLDIANATLSNVLKQAAISQSAADKYRKERNILFWIILVLTLGIGIGLFFKFKPKL